MSDYMPKCATCEHFESCIMQRHITEMALILWNISKAEDKADRKDEPTISKMEQVDKDINVRSKGEPQNGYHIFNGTSVYVSRLEDEPQTDCAWK